jgi:hypothetical protein
MNTRNVILSLVAAAQAAAPFVAFAAPKAGAAKPAAAAAATPDDAAASAPTAQTVLYESKPEHSIFSFDYGVPSSPAMTLLGLSADKNPPSTSLTPFVVSLPALFGKTGGASAALDFAPLAAFKSTREAPFDDYIPDFDAARGDMQHITPRAWVHRLGWRSRLGVAGLNGDAGGGDASKAVRSKVSAGYSVSLLDSADPFVVGDEDGPFFMARCLTKVATLARPVQQTNRRTEAEEAVVREIGKVDDFLADPTGQRAAAISYLNGLDTPIATAPAPPAPSERSEKIKAILESLKQAQENGDAARSPQLTAALAGVVDLLADEAPSAAQGKASAARPKPPPVVAADVSKDELVAALRARRKVLMDQQAALAAARVTTITTQLAKAEVPAKASACSDKATALARFGRDLDFGFGALQTGDPGRLEHFRNDGEVVWLAFQQPLGSPKYKAVGKDAATSGAQPISAWLATFYVRKSWGERVQTQDKTTPEIRADVLDASVGLERISDTFRFSGEYGWQDTHARDLIGKPFEKSGERYLLSAQYRLGGFLGLSDGTWLGVSYGNGYGTIGDLKATTALVTLSYSPPKPPDISKSTN